MKKLIFCMLLALLLTTLGACAKNEAPASDAQTPSYTLGQSSDAAGNAPSQPQAGAPASETEMVLPQGEEGIDVDLTVLSSTMVYAEVYNIMLTPDDYLGKTIKMKGTYYANYYEPTDKYYHAVIIADAAACCAQGLEFVWEGDHQYPDDYPANETQVVVSGVFESYEENGMPYYQIRTNEVIVA